MELDEKYRIVTDENNVILQFFEQRTRKVKKTETEEEYEYTENYYYPTIKTALKGFLNKSVKECKTVEQILAEFKRLEGIIDNLKIS